MRKVFVDVLARHDAQGQTTPLLVVWEDGRKFEIGRVLDVRPGASRKVGGAGIRYLVRIGRHETVLFEEEGRWFVEGKDAPERE